MSKSYDERVFNLFFTNSYKKDIVNVKFLSNKAIEREVRERTRGIIRPCFLFSTSVLL